MSSKSRDQIWEEWRDFVNMTPKELAKLLETEKSKSVGSGSGRGKTKGHKSGHQIVEIKRTIKDDLRDDHWEHMAKVVGHIKRQRTRGGPEDNVEHSAWRYSLMNWGHDPLDHG